MSAFVAENYDWFRAFHLIFLISWLAGLFYLPRLFVYHAEVEAGSGQDRLFQVMEGRLLRIIMNPAMIGTWAFGLLLLAGGGWGFLDDGWFQAKLVLVVILSGLHMALARWRRLFAAGENQNPARFYRIVNEAPTVLMIVIVFLVILKPGAGG